MVAQPDAQRRQRNARGARAEKHVFRILRELGDDYAVFNCVPARYGDIDHVVIRRDGTVFMIETKAHHGMVTYDGRQLLLNGHPCEKDFIAQISRNIPWLREKIRLATGMNVWIVAILVFPNALVYSDKGRRVLQLKPVKRINVVTRQCLKRVIESYIPAGLRCRALWQKLNNIASMF